MSGTVDWTRVRELMEEVGQENFDEIVSMFIEETDEVVARLPGEDTARALERSLHFLKGSALNLGMSGFAHLCQSGERSAASGIAGIDVATITACYRESRSVLMSGLQEVQAA